MAQERLRPGGAGGQAAVDCHNEWRSADSADRIGAEAPPLRDYQTDIEARGDGRGPGGDLFSDLVKVRAYAWLIEGGYLVPPIVFAAVNPDLKEVRTLDTGDYSPSELEERMNTSALAGGILEHWFRLGKNRRTILLTAVRHSAHLRNEFRRTGVAAEHLDAKTSLDERSAPLPGSRLA